MIAKAVPARKGTSSLVQLARYITGIKAQGDPVGWPALADYITDARSDGARVEHVRLTNRYSDEVGPAVKEILSTQARNQRSGNDRIYHLVVAFPPGERPTREQLDDIEDELCAAIGFAGHQRISAAHDDTDHFHLHVAISKVHPDTYRNVTPRRDYPKLMEACTRLELKHGLTVTNHGQAAEQRTRGRAGDMEVHGGRESLSSWIRTNAAEALGQAAVDAGSWEALHQVAGQHGLEFRRRGAGLTIGAIGAPEAVKASEVSRALSFKALTDRLGPFMPAERGATTAEPVRRYSKGPKQASGTSALFEAYQREREAALAARKAAQQQARAERGAYAVRLRLSHAERRRLVRDDRQRSPAEKRTAYRRLAAERKASWAENSQVMAEERSAIGAAHPLPTWQSFLERAVRRGDVTAIAALRSRQRKQEKAAQAVLSAEDAQTARHVVYDRLMPTVKRNGDLIYRMQDGGCVTDSAHQVRVDELSVGAAFLALSIAGDRFGDRPLKVEGSAEFKAQVAELAADKQMKVRFADSALERVRMPAQPTMAIDTSQAQAPENRQRRRGR